MSTAVAGGMTAIPFRHVRILMLAAVAFAVGNVAWRFGEGDTLLIVVERSALGVLLVAPVLWRAYGAGTLQAVWSDRWATVAVLTEGAALVATAFLLRGMTGPVVALVLAVTPALLLLPTKLLSGVLSRRSLPYVALTVTFACLAALSGGLGPVSARSMGVAAVWLSLRLVSILSLERARSRHASSVLISGGMVVAAVGSAVVLAVAGTGEVKWSVSGLVVATIVAVFGTSARMLQTYSLPHLGSVVTSTTAQMSALLTAVGGVLLLDDPLHPAAAALGLLAAGAAVRATMLASAGATESLDEEQGRPAIDRMRR